MKFYGLFLLFLVGLSDIALSEEAGDRLSEAHQAFSDKDYVAAYNLFSSLQNDPSGAACYYLGVMNQQGWGKISDPGAAAKFYRCAIDNGHVRAMHNLAGLYHRGKGIEQDLKAARELYTRAANLGGVKSAHRLGLIYFQGDGVDRDFVAARHWWQKAFSAGEADSGYNLGILHKRGLGTSRSATKAQEIWLEAAKLGSPHAQNAYGSALMNGEGATPDPITAYAWFRAAAAAGISVAQINSELVWQGLPEQAQEQALRRAAEVQQLLGE